MRYKDVWLSMPIDILQEYLEAVEIDLVTHTNNEKRRIELQKLKESIINRLNELNENNSSLQS